MTTNWPVGSLLYCSNCKVYYNGPHQCWNGYHVWVYPQTFSAPGWRCPVCGTGVSPQLLTHCDKPALPDDSVPADVSS